MKQIIFSLLFCAGLATSIQAQTTVHNIPSKADSKVERAALAECVYLDAEEKICYLDLEQVPVNVTQAVLIDKSGDEVINKRLQEIPVNSIVELDYSNLPSGSYILELRSHRSTSHKALRL